MGEVPTWFRVIQAAKYLGVAPWDLWDESWEWVLMAEEADAAVQYGRQLAEEKATKRAKGKG